MPNAERKILNWLDGRLCWIALAAFAVMGLWIRLPMMDFVSNDARFFLLLWFDRIREQGLGTQVGDYNLVYQFLIFLMTRLPVEPLHAYKILSVWFDCLLAAGVGLLGYSLSKSRWKGVLAFGAVLLSPIAALNSAAWAQCDSMFCCFAVFALLALVKERYPLAMVLLGLSFSCKLQAVFFLPVFLFVYYQRRRFSLLWFGLIPLTMLLTGLPMVFFGRNPLDVFSIYGSQTGTYPCLSMNYPSPWLLLAQARSAEQYALLKWMAILVTLAILAVLMIRWIRSKAMPEGTNLISMAFLLAYTCVLFLPAMHERYGYPYEILAILLAVLQPKTAPVCAGLLGISLCTYGSYLFDAESLSLVTLAVLNAVAYGMYLRLLSPTLLPNRKPH